jgi:acyl dehydratase
MGEQPLPFFVGYRFSQPGKWTEDDLIAGARFLDDRNPLHNDPEAARSGRFGRLIASGPHISGLHACMLPTHCVGLGIEVLGTNFTIRYAAPVFAATDYVLTWEVVGLKDHRSGASLVDWVGSVAELSEGRASIEATGQILVTAPPPSGVR